MEPTNLTRLSDATEIIDAAAVCLCDDGQTVEDVLDRAFLLQLRQAIVDELKARDEAATQAAADMQAKAAREVDALAEVYQKNMLHTMGFPANQQHQQNMLMAQNVAEKIRALPLQGDTPPPQSEPTSAEILRERLRQSNVNMDHLNDDSLMRLWDLFVENAR